MCRKAIFVIDDNKYFKEQYNLTDEQALEVLTIPTFKAIYSLFGNGNNLDRYELVDVFGNSIDINKLNGYQKAMILGECENYFMGIQKDKPCGVVEMKEMFVESFWMVEVSENKITGEIIGEIHRTYAERKPEHSVSIDLKNKTVIYRSYYKALNDAKAWRDYWMNELLK